MNRTLDVWDQIKGIDDVQAKYLDSIKEVDKIHNNCTKFSMFHMNIRSVQKNFDELLLLLQQSKITHDLIILSETWKNECKNIEILNYRIFYNNANFNQNDGVIVYAGASVEINNFHIERFNEVTFSIFEMKKNDTIYILVAIYRPPSSNPALFIQDLDIVMGNLRLPNEAICIVTGDINLDLADQNNNFTQQYINILATRGFESQINCPTRVTPETSTVIDHIFLKNSNINKLIPLPIILRCSITDHYATLLYMINHKTVNEITNTKTINILNKNRLLQTVQNEPWTDTLSETNANTAASKFINRLKYLINTCTKRKTIEVKNCKKIKPWITDELISQIKLRDRLKQRYINSNNNLNLKTEYTNFRNRVTSLIRKTKNSYYKQKFTESRKDIKQVWQLINEATNEKKKSENRILKIISEDREVITDSLQISNEFNSYFCSIGTKMTDKIKNSTTNFQEYPIRVAPNSIFLSPTTDNEIMNIVNSLKNGGSPGWDGILGSTLKLTLNQIIKPLKHIIDTMFQTGKFPEVFKRTIVIPIHKQGKDTDLNNYRPISLISNVAKIAEKCIKNRIGNFIEAHNILSNLQFGFRAGRSTVDAVHTLVSSVHEALNKCRKPLAIYLDLAKAFDTVSHEILINKLHSYGFRGVCADLLRDYLSNRLQCVSVNSNKGTERVITMGIPQGTVIGPLLFQLYLNDMLELRFPGSVISYADDTVLVVDDDTWEGAKVKSERGLNIILAWLNSNFLSLNMNKTKFMAFSLNRTGQPQFQTLTAHTCREIASCPGSCNRLISKVSDIRYLGIQMDSFLKWDCHIHLLIKRIRSTLYKFYQLRYFMDTRALECVYVSLVESILNYAVPVWGGAYETHLHPLKIIQKQIIKVILNKPKLYPTELIFQSTQLMDFDTVYILAAVNFVHKHQSLRPLVNHGHNTRSVTGMNCQTKKPSNASYSRFVDLIGIKLYNLLPLSVKSQRSYKHFKRASKSHIQLNIEKFRSVIT